MVRRSVRLQIKNQNRGNTSGLTGITKRKRRRSCKCLFKDSCLLKDTAENWNKFYEPFQAMQKNNEFINLQLESRDMTTINAHREVMALIITKPAVKKQILSPPKEIDEIKKIKLDLDTDHVKALVDFAYTGQIKDEYLETLQDYGLSCLYQKMLDDQEHQRQMAARPWNTYVLAVSGWIHLGPGKIIEVFDVEARTWGEMATPLNLTRAYHGTVFMNDKIYLFGGYEKEPNTHNGGEYCSELFSFDPKSKKWDILSNMHEKRCYVSYTHLDGHIYAIGGFDGQSRHNSVERYDPALDAWYLIAPMNFIRSDGAAVAFGDKIYAIGGFDGLQIHSSVEIYNRQRNQWSHGPTMNTPRTGVKAVVYHNKIYAIGGFNGITRLRTVEVLDPNGTNQWEFVANMMIGRSNHSATVFNDNIIVLGGFEGVGIIRDTEVFNDVSGTWTRSTKMRHRKSALTAITVKSQQTFNQFKSDQPDE